jgi:hypothetical protein
MTPSWLTDLLAGLMLVVAAYCAGRVVFARLRHRPTEHDVDLLHVLMGVAMAGMLTSRLSILNNHIWETLFAVAVVWFAGRTVLALRGSRSGSALGGGADASAGAADRAGLLHRFPYLLAPGAMLYMYLAPMSATSGSGGGGMAGMADSAGAASRFPTLGLLLAALMVGFAVLTTDRTVLASPASTGGLDLPGAPGALSDSAAPGSPGRAAAARSHCGLLAPRTANGCHIAMSITMAYMLVILL